MESLKNKIQNDFITALKAKDEVSKSTLGFLKSKITEVEKKDNRVLSNDEVMKVILSSIKQRNQSIVEFEKGGRVDLVDKEKTELEVLNRYLPSQMTEDEIETEVKIILTEIGEEANINKKIGTGMGMFTKKFNGRADTKFVMEKFKSLV